MLTFFWSCSTKKNTFSRRVYHNLTAHYNAYWNGKESLKEGELELLTLAQENYTFVLPVFNYGTKENSMSLNPYMDRAIEKATLVIQRHSMYFNDKEYVRWIDDSYLLIGTAYFYKHEYNMAKRTFDYMIKRFQDDPIKYDAMIWLADTYIQLEEWDKAQSLLDLVQSKILKEPVSRNAEARLSAVYADFYIKQNLYNQAIIPLENALSDNQNKLLLTRMEFILGQIYQLNKDYEAATEYYTKVIKHNPPYEMSFNAKINLAQSYDVSTGNSKLVIKKLEKMLKDEKNIEYQDQIYYALAEIAIREGNDTLAIHYYKISVSTSLTNNYQKAISALKLADLYYSYPDYIFAQVYYDSSMMFLPSDFPDYEAIASKTETLTDLVTNILIIHEQDSLQDLARMSEKERNAIIQEFIAAYKEEEKKKKQEEILRQQNLAMTSQSFQTKQNVQRLSGGKWYFYNPSTLSYGYTEFIKKWGNRKLEDLWRIKNKQMISYGYEDEIVEVDTMKSDSTKSFISDPMKPEYYLQNLPMTPELMEASDAMLAEALYKTGYIYKEGIYDYPNAVKTFDEFIDRFPDNEYVLESYYHLYKIYQQQNNEEQLEYIKNLMVREYPDSDYAKIIIDPDYNLVLLAQKNKAASLYEETYQAYMNEQYLMVKIYTDEAISSYAEDKNLIPKFEYLRTLAKGKTDGTDSLVFGLQDIITRYPSHEVTPLAQNILTHLYGSPDIPEQILEDGTIVTSGEEQIEETSPYIYEPDIIHFYILIVNALQVNVNATKVKISDYHMKYHKLDNLTISSVLLDNSRQMITVSSFKNKENALAYYSGIKNSDYVFSNIHPLDYQHFVLSGDNYKTFYQNKDADQYQRFFTKNYLSGTE